MNYIDIVLGIIILLSAFRGLRKGFVVELASLLALLLGVWGAIHFSQFVANYIIVNFDYQPKSIGLISFLITFFVIVVVVHILGNVLDQLIKALALGLLNQLAGFLFGAIKTALILSVLLIIFDKIDSTIVLLPQEDKQESRVYEPLRNLVPTVLPFLNFWDDDIFLQKKDETNDARVVT